MMGVVPNKKAATIAAAEIILICILFLILFIFEILRFVFVFSFIISGISTSLGFFDKSTIRISCSKFPACSQFQELCQLFRREIKCTNIEIVECPIIREEDGLAKSSRNTLLAPDERAIAPAIYKALVESTEYAKSHSLSETHDKVVADIIATKGLEVEYFSIVDGNTLQDVASWDDSKYIVGCITVYCGKTPIRLIDHIKYKEEK